MTKINLLDINVDSLFEQHHISEIDQIHTNLQSCIEGKKEELRMMVGERYRDLLQAADTINLMKTTSKTIIEQIDSISATCHSLNDKQLIGFKTQSPTSAFAAKQFQSHASDASKTEIRHYYGCVSQIYLLTILPEIIWSHLDNGDYCAATQLFMLSRHISTGLQLDTNSDIVKRFPTARQQWNNLNQFYLTIKQLCLEQLEQPEIAPNVAMKCLASLMLLESCQMDKILLLFIQLRSKAFVQALNENDGRHRTQKLPTIKEKLIASLRILVDTVSLLYKCFVDTENDQVGDGVENCCLVRELKRITWGEAKPTISLIKNDDSLLKQFLPTLVSKFRPQVQFKSIEAKDLKKAVDTWMDHNKNESQQFLQANIQNIGSIRTIHSISQTFLKMEKPQNWAEMLESLQLPANLDFYSTYYQPQILQRVKAIISLSMAKTNEESKKEICDLMDTLDDDWTMPKSFWNEDVTDNPLSLKQALDTNKQNHKLLMKAMGFTAEICQVCSLIDKNVETLYNDLHLYLSTIENEYVMKKENETMRRVQFEIQQYLRDCTQQSITELLTNIREIAITKNSKRGLIFLTKFLEAVKLICPYLKLCLIQTTLATSSQWNDRKMSNLENWDRICALLDEESLFLWRQWIERFVRDILVENQKYCFDTDIEMTDLLNIFSNWETIQVVEKDDKDTPVQSQIRVPCQPSIPLQYFLFKCCKHLNEMIPSALPVKVVTIITRELLQKARDTYNELHINKFVSGNQNVSLQYYFDLKLLNLLFLAEHRDENLQALIMKFKENIDPFDFELFHKYLNNNVKLAALRSQHQYGLLIANKSHLSSVLANVSKQTMSTQDKEPNVLALSINSAQKKSFPLLPVVIATKSTSTGNPVLPEKSGPKGGAKMKSEKRKSPTKSTIQESVSSSVAATQQNLANVKSNAAAFFGAMSQDWFR